MIGIKRNDWYNVMIPNALVASSKSKTAGFLIKALAIAILE